MAKDLKKTIQSYYAPVKDPQAFWEQALGPEPKPKETSKAAAPKNKPREAPSSKTRRA